MVNLPGGFSPINAIKQVGSYINPTGGAGGYSVFNNPQSASQNQTIEGSTYFDTGTGQVMTYSNGAWGPMGGGGNVLGASTNAGSPAPASGGAARPVLNRAAVDNTQRTIDQLPGLLAAALAAENQNYSNTIGGFNSQEQSQRKTYDGSTVTNQQNYDSNFMDSIRAGIKGLGGLMALLRGTGAAGGTVDDQVRDIVGGVTANDIRMGADTQKENQTALDNSLSSFLTDLQLKRRQAEDTRVNNERAIRRESNSQMQDLYGKMAGYYGDAGNTGAANDWMNRAGSLTPDIAANSRTQVSPYDTSPVAVQAPQLTAFSAPTQPDVVASPSDGRVGSGIFTMSDRRKKEPATPTLAGA